MNNSTSKKRNLLIYSYNHEIESKYKNWMSTDLPVYKLYYGNVYNPPYFDNIISLRNNTLEDIQQIWNMTVVGGSFIVEEKHKAYFKNFILVKNNGKENKRNHHKYIIITKNTNFTYIFPRYRVLEFIIAGTMKGGTTAGIKNLSMHPDISMVKEEIHYYDNKENYQKGIEWYKSHFNYTKKSCGDKNHDVMYEYSCLELLQMVNPQVKIILFLRNPIERAYSHWKMTRDLFKNQKSFEFCVNDEINHRMGENRLGKIAFWYHFVQRGLYYEQIQEMLKYFPRDNIFISISEKIRNNMDEEYNKMFKFLNLDQYHGNFEEIFVSKSKDNVDKNSKIYKLLKNIYKDDVRKLEKFLGYSCGWNL